MHSQNNYYFANMNTRGATPQQSPQGGWTPTPRPVTEHLARKRRRKVLLISLFVGALVIATVLGAASVLRGNSTIVAQEGGQAPVSIDLNQSFPISPYLLGSNVFPKVGTNSKDAALSGFMSYSPQVVAGLKSAHVQLLRFPGGNWGEEHTPSVEQLNDFSDLLNQVGAEGIMQVQLSDPNDITPVPLDTRATRASLLVDYMNNRQSIQRLGQNSPFHPIKYWTIGNEPDLLINPDTGKKFTVADYVNDFITYSLAMHQRDPNIKIFGPEISQYQGQAQEPKDATRALWMDDFLKGIAAYERTNSLPFHILDGVSFHRYPFGPTGENANALLNNPAQWDSALPTLRQFIVNQFGTDLPIAITEINTNSGKGIPAQNLAAAWWAETLGELMSNQVQYVTFFSTEGVNAPYPLFTTPNLNETALLRVMQLFAQLQNNLVPLQGQNGPVSIYATQDGAHNTVSLFLVNKTATDQQVSIHADSILPLTSWHSANVNLHSYDLMVLTLHRNGSNEALSFSNSQSTQQNAPALQHLQCGDNTNGTC